MAATTTAPVTQALSQKEFKEKLNNCILKPMDELIELSAQIAKAKAHNQKLMTNDGRNIGKRELNAARSELAKIVRSFAKDYAQARKPRRRTGKKGGTGFRMPIYVSDSIRGFFTEANLGNAYTVERTDPNKPKVVRVVGEAGVLRDVIQLLINRELQKTLAKQINQADIPGITSSALLTPLFSIYALQNKLTDLALVSDPNGSGRMVPQSQLPEEQKNRQLLGADPLMRKHFGSTFVALAAQGPHTTAKGTEVGAFSADNFKYAAFQSIVKLNRRTVDGKLKDGNTNPAGGPLSDMERSLLQAPEIADRLAQEQAGVSDTLCAIKEQSKPLVKAIRAGKRKARVGK